MQNSSRWKLTSTPLFVILAEGIFAGKFNTLKSVVSCTCDAEHGKLSSTENHGLSRSGLSHSAP